MVCPNVMYRAVPGVTAGTSKLMCRCRAAESPLADGASFRICCSLRSVVLLQIQWLASYAAIHVEHVLH